MKHNETVLNHLLNGNRPLVISLCDLTANMVEPWVEAGYDAILVDPQHGESRLEERLAATIYYLAETVLSSAPYISAALKNRSIAAVFGFPPCTDMAVSGSRWFESKRRDDPQFQSKAAIVAEQCRTIGELSGAPYFVENPVSVLSSIFGKPSYTFNPHDFTAYEPSDNYTKKTCLWAGGGFVMPETRQNPSLGKPDDRIHKAPPGPERMNFRSATPRGFAQAVFHANAQFELAA